MSLVVVDNEDTYGEKKSEDLYFILNLFLGVKEGVVSTWALVARILPQGASSGF